MFITLSVVYIQISNTYLPEFPNILLYVEANPVWMRRLYSAVIFSSKLDYSYRSTNVLKAFFSAMHAVWSLWSCVYHEIKEILRKLSLSEYFKAISLYFPCLFTLGLNDRSIYELVFFVARAGFQVPVLTAVQFRW